MYLCRHVILSIILVLLYIFLEIQGSFLSGKLEKQKSESQNVINSCCLSQSSYHDHQCFPSPGNYYNTIAFPKSLFGKYTFEAKRPNCNETSRIFISAAKLKYSILDEGKFLLGSEYFSPEEYCIDSIGPKTAEVIIHSKTKCQEDEIPKCCGQAESFDLLKGRCYSKLSSKRWKRIQMGSIYPFKYPKLYETSSCRQIKNFTNVKCWEYPVRYEIGKEGNSTLQYESVNGVFLRGKWETLNEPWCVEELSNSDSICESGNEDPEIVFYCTESDEVSPFFYALLMGCLWIATAALLLVTAILNVVIVQRNSHGWVLFCYLITSALLNVIAGVFILVVDENRIGCNFIDFATKFLYSSTLCWMTMINFDLWWAFRYIDRKMETMGQRSTKRLPCYCIFSWSVPTCIVSTCWVIGRNGVKKTDTHCILYDQSLLFYSSGPIVFLIVVNLCLFIRTALTIQDIRSSTRAVLRRSSRVQRESFRLFSKLFLMSGPIWLLRVVLLALQFHGNYLTWYGVTIEGIFSLPDVAFFLLVVLHPNVIRRLRERIPCLTTVSQWFHSSSIIVRNSIRRPDLYSLRTNRNNSIPKERSSERRTMEGVTEEAHV